MKTEETSKSSKSKRTSKSRSKKSETSVSAGRNGNSSHSSSTPNAHHSGHSRDATPTTPTVYDSSQTGSGCSETQHSPGKSANAKHFVGLDAQSVQVYYEQLPKSDTVELPVELCERIAEDATYALYEIIDDIKLFARHSGNVVDYDLVNEVLTNANVPPMLGALDTEYERAEIAGNFYFHSDSVVELHDEYLKDVCKNMPDGIDIECHCPIDPALSIHIQKFVPSLLYAALMSGSKTCQGAISLAATTPLMAHCYRLILSKLIDQLAFKQSDEFSARCWRVLRSCTDNPYANRLNCNMEYFNLAEILICQLLAPIEKIKEPTAEEPIRLPTEMKMEIDSDFNIDPNEYAQEFKPDPQSATDTQYVQIQLEQDEDVVVSPPDSSVNSCYFASPVDNAYVDELCKTIGTMGAHNGYMMTESMHQICCRLERFFSSRDTFQERDYYFVGRAVRGLQALGEYAFREFIPHLYKLPVDDIPDSLWSDLIPAANFLKGQHDIFLYEWLAYGCGADRLQPYMTYYARVQEKYDKQRALLWRKRPFKITPKLTPVRSIEWNTSRSISTKPTIRDYFPEYSSANIRCRDTPVMHFKFNGCRPTLKRSQQKTMPAQGTLLSSILTDNRPANTEQYPGIVVGRRIYKRIANVMRRPLSGLDGFSGLA